MFGEITDCNSVIVHFTYYILSRVLEFRNNAVHLTSRCSSDCLRLDRDRSSLSATYGRIVGVL